MIDVRLRTRIADNAMDTLTGKVLGPADYDLLLTGPTYLRKPNNQPLAVYLPAALTACYTEPIVTILRSLRPYTTDNRGHASGTRRQKYGNAVTGYSKRTRSVPVASALAGSIDPSGAYKYCRQTAWTGRHLPEWQQLQPLLSETARQLAHYVPHRHTAQTDHAATAQPEWIVPGTPFSTITVNNSYPTGVHKDKGDYEPGFSTLSCARIGTYSGGQLVFPQYRAAVDMRHGDLLLMDAHDWHGNVPLTCGCGTQLNGPCPDCHAERISVVAYLRTNITTCGTAAQELEKARTRAEASH